MKEGKRKNERNEGGKGGKRERKGERRKEMGGREGEKVKGVEATRPGGRALLNAA